MAEIRKLSPSALKRLMTEEKQLLKDTTINEFVARPRIYNNTKDYSIWDIYLRGSEGSLYDGCTMHAVIEFPREYPIFPPQVRFLTEMFHPNIYKDGTVCISILHLADNDPSNYEKPDEKWSPVYCIHSVIISVINLLNEPNTESPANVDASTLYMRDIETYKRQVKRLARENSVKIPK
ncbi:Ubiquitin-conjugating enzyme E2-18 kDa [Dictyocoela roeselum]|nr:Ubiquitin-conjugating enzyme E2-18 kDa [Dictyocoela roeselum]